MRSTQWKNCESKCGIWLGAYRSGTKSGRIPLSGANSGTTRSDTAHQYIFAEVKRSKTYLSAVKLWEEYCKEDKKKKSVHILTLPIAENKKIIAKTSDIWCFHNDDAEFIYSSLKNNIGKLEIHEWKGNYPSVLTLYHSTIRTWKNSLLDRHRKVAHCAIFSHSKIGFWIVINKNDIINWWELVLQARIEREKFLKEEEEFMAANPKPVKITMPQKADNKEITNESSSQPSSEK
ncbi:MAG: hypothetical protein M0P71_13815 [Melioribacteraceae bacterium]|nr:hypothetical protein [Melioribacteraceae bacterium]